MRRFLFENSLSLVMLGLFALALTGQTLTGFDVDNKDRVDHDEPPISFSEYLGSGHFVEAVFENWESEFLQMSAYVVLTIFLRQKGSPESRPLHGEEPSDKDPRTSRRRKDLPWPVRRGGLVLTIYENSLSLVLFLLFVMSFLLHAVGGSEEYSEEQIAHGGEAVSVAEYLGTSQFWFESMQNWQSEFLSIAALVVLSVFLRQKGSPESKPVDAPHYETGGD